MQGLAKGGLAKCENAKSFFHPGMFAEEKRIRTQLRTSGVGEAQVEHTLDNHKMPLGDIVTSAVGGAAS
jgi:hypothetical protein